MAVKFSNNASALLDGAITNSATSVVLDDVSESFRQYQGVTTHMLR